MSVGFGRRSSFLRRCTSLHRSAPEAHLGWTFNEKYEGLAAGKKARIALASMGTYTPGAYMENANLSPYMKFILGFIGIKDVEIYLAGGTSAINQGRTTLEAYLAEHTPKAVAELSK